jgi:cysteine desulfurase
MKQKKNIFLDHAAATPLDAEVIKAMAEVSKDNFANPSALYGAGVKAKSILNESREAVSRSLGVLSDEIIFTGSGTEADNLAIFGPLSAWKSKIKKPHIIVSSFEHPAILEAAFQAKNLFGAEVSMLPVSYDGFVDPKELKKSLKPNTVVVSIMHANNEIGTIQPIHEIAKEIRDYRKKKNKYQTLPYFHTDASQSVHYCDIGPHRLGIDLLTLDASKMYGPKGVGMLFVRRNTEIAPLIVGGGQEFGLRSGTENISLIRGFSAALSRTLSMRESEVKRLLPLQELAFKELTERYRKISINGSLKNRLPNNVNVCFPGTDSEFSIIKLGELGFSASSSSSCRTLKENATSYVIRALGKKDCIESSLRFTFGRSTTRGDVLALVKALSFLA